jgi:hypothetical protein
LAAVNPERQAPSAMAQEGMTEWTLEQESALAELVRESAGQASSSLELAQWVRREIQREISSQQFGRSWQEVESSPLGGQPPRLKGFWFNVNAELIIYGATDPDASVTIGGEPIEVRADGTFACRLALPDGEYDVDVAACLEADSRQAKLRFRRSTEYQEKDVHEQ